MARYIRWTASVGASLLALAAAGPLVAQVGNVGEGTNPAPAPTAPRGRPLPLDEALRVAAAASEEIEIAEAALVRSQGAVKRATSARLPQVNGSLSYSRTLASQFQGLGGDPGPVQPECEGNFAPDPSAPVEDRVSAIETELGCPAGFGGIDFDQIGFGSENTYNAGLSVSVPLFRGGRLRAQSRSAEASERVAEIGLTSAEAQLRLDATEAYFDAQLSSRLLEIAESTLSSLGEALRLTQLRVDAGTQAEYDLLRARVALSNQRPVVIQRRAQRDLAFERLRLMLDLQGDDVFELVTQLEDVRPTGVQVDTSMVNRAAVRQASEGLAISTQQVTIARAQRYPDISLISQYGQVYFGTLTPVLDQFRDNWSVGVGLTIPIFTGGRISADVRDAQAGVFEAGARLEQAAGLAILDARNTVSALDAAVASWEASQGTVEQAERAYQIAELRFAEGISTQLELTDAQILLDQARVNHATAARDLQVAQTRAELLPYLPFFLGGTGATAAAAAANVGVTNNTAASALSGLAGAAGTGAQSGFAGGATGAGQGTFPSTGAGGF